MILALFAMLGFGQSLTVSSAHEGQFVASQEGAPTKPTVDGFVDDGVTGTNCVPSDAVSNLVLWPVSGTQSPDLVVSPYGPRVLNNNYDFHAGIDIPPTVPGATIVRAAMDGIVVRKFREDQPTPSCRFGNWIMLRHPDSGNVRRYTTYLHLSGFLVNLGDRVSAGQPIGIMGRSGCGVQTEHLHFEYYENLSSTCGIAFDRSRNPFGLPLPVVDEREPSAQLGRLADLGLIILRAEIPAGKLDVVEYNIASSAASYRVDVNEKVGLAGAPCTKCCDKALGPNGNLIQLMPKRFTGDQNYVLCISVDNVDVTSTYAVSLRNAVGREYNFGPFAPDDPPADVTDCTASVALGCPDIGVCTACAP
jgi:murein DD-endopeptidase MepM/ murein hydrolase activator NlpD